MKEYVRRLNAKCRGEEIEGAVEEAKSDDDSVSLPQGGDSSIPSSPPGDPGDMSRVAGGGGQRKNAALKALERDADEEDDDDYGGKLPMLSNKISQMRYLYILRNTGIV